MSWGRGRKLQKIQKMAWMFDGFIITGGRCALSISQLLEGSTATLEHGCALRCCNSLHNEKMRHQAGRDSVYAAIHSSTVCTLHCAVSWTSRNTTDSLLNKKGPYLLYLDPQILR